RGPRTRPLSRRSPQRFHALALHRTSYRSLRAGQGGVDGGTQRCVPALEYHAGQSAQNDLDAARLIDTAARTVHILQANADALDGALVFSEFDAELASDVVPLDRPEIALCRTN